MPTVTIGETTLHYLDTGSGDRAVLLLHAFPFHSGMWEPQVGALAGRARVIAPDLKGFGASDAPDDVGVYSMGRYADEVAALARSLELDQVVVAGLSMGGYVAFSLLRQHRPLVGALVLADTRADSDSDEVLERRTKQQRQVREEGTKPVVDALLQTLLAERTHENRPDVVEHARTLMDNPPSGFVGALEAMKQRPDVTPELESIDVPTLVLVGEEDKPSPPEVAESMSERIRGSRLVVLPGAGHLSSLEVPDAFNEALLSFLDEL